MTNEGGLFLWSMRVVFFAITILILISALLPLQTVPRGWAGPDLLFCLALVWSVRRPDYVPLWLLAAAFFLADLVLFRPPGLSAALMLIACAHMQSRARRYHVSGFVAEWSRAALLIVAVTLVSRLALSIMLVPLPPLGLHVMQTITTTLAYPLAILISAMFGIRLIAPGDMDSFGQRA